MAHVGDHAHTPHGLGTITEVETVRGRSSFRVAGRGFNVWVDETKLHVASSPDLELMAGLESTIETGDTWDNSTTLPYNPTPQYPAESFPKEQTLLPGDYEIDPDERLHPADSVSTNKKSPNRESPGPAKHLFAAGRPRHLPHPAEGWGEYVHSQGLTGEKPFHEDEEPHGINVQAAGHRPSEGWPAEPDEEREWDWGSRPHLTAAAEDAHDNEFTEGPTRDPQGDDPWHEGLPEIPRTFNSAYDPYSSTNHAHHGPLTSEQEAWLAQEEKGKNFNQESGALPPMEGHGSGIPLEDTFDDEGFYDAPKGTEDPEDNAYYMEHGLHHGYYRPAGLSDRYAHVEVEAALDPKLASFIADPVRYIEMHGAMMSDPGNDHLDYKYADYSNLLDTDANLRTATWNDVRKKAMRLRHEGKVHIHHVSSKDVLATVEGDHGTYEVLIAKTGAAGGLGDQTIDRWSCGCEWGNWAFKRKYSYVGRLCSHGYAAYLEMQARHLQDAPEHFTKQYQFVRGPGTKTRPYRKNRKVGAALGEYKTWLKDNSQTPEAASIADFIHTADQPYSTDEVASLYDYVHANPDQVPERKFDVGYENDPEKVYKEAAEEGDPVIFEHELLKTVKEPGPINMEAGVLHTRPEGLTPNLREVPDDEDEQWVDVTKDERKTTGPDQIVHFSAIARYLHGAGPGGGEVGSTLPGAISDASQAGSPVPLQQQIAASLHHGFDWSKPFGNPFPGGSALNPHGSNPLGPSNPGINWGKAFANPFPGGSALNPHGESKNPFPAGSALNPGGNKPQEAVKTNQSAPAPSAAPSTGNQGGVPSSSTGQGPLPGQGQNHGPKVGEGAGYMGAGQQPSGNWQRSHEQTPIYQGTPSYTVKPGDTLNDIATRAGVGVDQLKTESGDPNLIRPGEQISIPGGGTPASAPKNNQNAQAPAQNVGNHLGSRRYAESSTPALIDKLREMSDHPASDALGRMDERNDELRDVIEELHDRGVDASFMVASLHYAEDDLVGPGATLGVPQEGNPSAPLQEQIYASLRYAEDNPDAGKANFPGQSAPDWADEPFQGTGPQPKGYFSDSQSWLDEHGPDLEDVTAHPDGDIIKFNDSRSKPQQGPRKGSLDDLTAALHYATDPHDPSGYFNPDNPDAKDWEEGSGSPFVSDLEQESKTLSGDFGEMDKLKKVLPLVEGGGGAGAGAAGAGGGAAAAGGGAAATGGAAAGAAGAGAGAAELAPALLALAGRRAGHGPTQQVRIDPGARQPNRPQQHQAAIEDFGYDGEPDLARYAADEGGNDIVAAFQRSAGADLMMGSPGPSGRDDFDIAGNAQAFLRTAGRKYSPREQRELEAEFHPQGARNLPDDDELAGTHYLLP